MTQCFEKGFDGMTIELVTRPWKWEIEIHICVSIWLVIHTTSCYDTMFNNILTNVTSCLYINSFVLYLLPKPMKNLIITTITT